MAGPVVVGVDGTVTALRAVRWAAEHADRHGVGLRLVHAVDRPYSDDRVIRLLRAAEDAAHVAAGGVAVTAAAAEATPAQLLVRESGDASLVVLGGRGHGGFTGHLIGATTLALADHGASPMVVMTGEPGRGPVVVGTDGTPTSDAALGFAFHEALARGTDLLIVESRPGGEDRPDALTERLASWQARHPEVAVHRVLVPDAPGRALLDRAEGAQLVVVGGRHRLGCRGPVLRATGQLLLHHAPCPLAVVRWDHPVGPLWTVSKVLPGGDQ